jgi:hypothetical protein
MNGTTGAPDSAADRISSLERQAMRLRIGVLAALIFAVVALYQAFLATRRLDALAESPAIRSVGKDGRFSLLGIQPDGSVGLVLFDAKENLRASFLVRPDGTPRIDLFDAGMKRRVLVGLKPDGTPGIETLDADGKPAKAGP